MTQALIEKLVESRRGLQKRGRSGLGRSRRALDMSWQTFSRCTPSSNLVFVYKEKNNRWNGNLNKLLSSVVFCARSTNSTNSHSKLHKARQGCLKKSKIIMGVLWLRDDNFHFIIAACSISFTEHVLYSCSF